MRVVVWRGERPPRAVVEALRAGDIGIHSGRHTLGAESPAASAGAAAGTAAPARAAAAAGAPVIVFTRGGRVPSMATTGAGNTRPWMWVTSRWPGEERCREAVIAGAYDVIALDRPDAVAQLVARAEELFVGDPPMPHADGLGLVAESGASRRVLAQVARVAPTSMPVLLTGETGTGKEVLARLIHAWSPRHGKQFVPINCAAIPNELMEAELFGYARGAFSGAVQGYDGQLMAAAGGTVFMDEIDDTPLATQVKLLRVLEDRVVGRLGENAWHTVDFRILAATNRDLDPLIREGAFGSDLYERLAIVTIHLVPLRERLEDLSSLARQFLVRFAREQPQTGAARVKDIRADALRALQAYAWPGNIRELRNVIYETLVYKRAGEQILLADLPKRILTRESQGSAMDRAMGSGTDRALVGTAAPRAGSEVPTSAQSCVDMQRIVGRISRGEFNLRDEVAALQRVALEEALRRAGGNATKAARLLGSVGRGRASDPGGTVRAMARRFRLDA